MEESKLPEKGLPPGFRIEDDGSLVFGDGCLIVKPNGKDLRITVDDTACGQRAAEAYLSLLQKTIGRGGKTIYEVPAKIEDTLKIEETIRVEKTPKPSE